MTAQKTMLVSVFATIAVATQVNAGVKSMTSDEMTETFIKDTTIIVTPAERRQETPEDKEKARRSLTISPGEAEKSEAEEQAEFAQFKDEQNRQLEGAIASYEEQVRRDLIFRERTQEQLPAPEVSLLYSDRLEPNIPGFKVPEGDFAYNFIGNQLGLSRDNDQLTMSFGNLPGVDKINLPREVTGEGPVQLIPRNGGGFDMIIDIPKN